VNKRTHSLFLKSYPLHYSCRPGGSKVLLAFHGFGQSKTHLEELEQSLATDYTVYSFDLFYHGENAGQGPENPLTKEEWAQWLQFFFDTERIQACSVLGFSLGGRFALATVEAFPERVKELLLIAPDGIKPNLWYTLATRPGWTQSLFRKVVYHPSTFGKLSVLARTFRLAHPKLIRFAQSQLETAEKQDLLYRSWVNFRLLTFNMAKMATLLNQNRIRTEIFLGRHDLLLKEKDVEPLINRLKNYRIIYLESGHTHLLDRAAAYFQWQTPSGKRMDA
jgi:pimeloyl-ACP methyl ester carboxylesterase